jgi:SAM-dependent methyltransferase
MAFQYDRPPPGETRFDWKEQTYRRGYRRCKNCGHWSAEIEMDLTNFYRGGYVDGTYGKRMKETFLKILALPAEQSDNQGRVRKVLEYAQKHLEKKETHTLLDVGSGLAVFPYRMKEAGWKVTALDPDARAATHAREVAGVRAIHADFLTWEPKSEERFDLITLNKVLEHVEDPVAMLSRARRWIRPGGILYVEVPDASAAKDGPEREEFFIEHLHVFSRQSLIILVDAIQLKLVSIKSIKEKSGKFTIIAFLKNKDQKIKYKSSSKYNF